jgi:hypothetical protein
MGASAKKSKRDKVVTVYVTEEMLNRFRTKADSLGLTVSSFLMIAAADYLKQDDALAAMKQINLYDLMRQSEEKK